MINVVTNAQLDAEEAAVSAMEEGLDLDEETLQGIAGHITKCWEAARTHKEQVTPRIEAAQRSRRGEYSAAKLAEIRQVTGGSEEFGRVVSNKCRVAESWLKDVYLGQTESAWVLKPTEVPKLTPDDMAAVEKVMQQEILEVVATQNTSPPESMLRSRKNDLIDATRMRIMEEAKLAVSRMSDKIDDQLTEACFAEEWADFLNDFCTYPAAHFKGPLYRRKTMLNWETVGGKWKPVPSEEIVATFGRIDPMRAYPAPGSVNPQERYWIEHIDLERGELYDLKGAPGFNEAAIDEVLIEHEHSGLRNWLGVNEAYRHAEDNGASEHLSPDQTIDALEYYGPVQGKQLLEWGVPKSEIDDELKDYEVTAWLINRHVIKAVLNPHPLGLRNIYKASWEEVPSEYWGQGLPDSLRDVEGITNAAIRSLVNNMAMASGPQVAVNVDRLAGGSEEIESQHPWKLWQVRDSEYGSNSAAVDFFQPNINSGEILGVLDAFYKYGDDWSLIPRYMGGSDSISGGIGRTASGMSMLFNAANKGLKGVVATIDVRVITPLMQSLYTYNMMFEEDESIKGDAQVEARGAIALMQIETLQLRRNEFLQATANPVDMQLTGLDGRREVLRSVAKGLDMDVNRVVPREGAQQMPTDPAAAPNGQDAISQPNEDQLFTGQPVTNNFGNNSMRSAQ